MGNYISSKSIEATKKLIKTYRSITLKEIHDHEENLEDFLRKRTGFGNKNTCTLCEAVSGDCSKCVHSLNDENNPQYFSGYYPCINESYDNIEDAVDNNSFYEAINDRADYLEFLINNIGNNY